MTISYFFHYLKKHFYHPVYLWKCRRRYEGYLPAIKRRIAEKDQINVLFFAINVGMWKATDLYRLFEKNPMFNPVVVSSPRPNDLPEIQKKEQDDMKAYFQTMNIRFVEGYDFATNTPHDLSKLNPDIVFFATHYNNGIRGFRLEDFWDRCLFFIIPYCLEMESYRAKGNYLLENISSAIFCQTEYHEKAKKANLQNHGKNVITTGYLLYDDLAEPEGGSSDEWKSPDSDLKRIIWAPHHSIRKEDNLNYGRFLDIADDMLEIAQRYRDMVQFVFKPHPHLRNKLYSHPDWGKERTDAYYAKWKELPTTNFVDGNYIDIFKTSDALIHDCSSFTGEYLYTKKPLLFTSDTATLKLMNEFGNKCYRLNYHGSTITDIENFIKDVVIGGNDSLLEERRSFVEKYLTPPTGTKVSENMYNSVVKIIDQIKLS